MMLSMPITKLSSEATRADHPEPNLHGYHGYGV